MKNNDKTFESALEAYLELQKPIYHTPISLGINQFKRQVRTVFKGKSSVANKLIKAFKKRAWMEYQGVARLRGNFPTHPAYGKKIEVVMDKGKSKKVTINGQK